MADIFISHAHADLPLVDAFVQLLEGGIGVPRKEIFCTSLESQGVPAGVDFKSHIQDQLAGAKLVIGIISQRFYNSPFCMCELGAVWIQAADFKPLLVPPVSFNDLRGVLGGTQCLVINSEKDIDSLYNDVAKLVVEPHPVVRWNTRKGNFLAGIDGLIKNLPPITTINPAEFKKLLQERDQYAAEYKKADATIQQLEQTVERLKSAKDSKEVAEIMLEDSGDEEAFRQLVEAAHEATKSLPRVVTEGLYYFFRGEEHFRPDHDRFGEDVDRNEEDKLLERWNGDFAVNSKHPKNRRAIQALEALQQFVNQVSPEFQEWYEAQYDDLLDFGSRSFWERHRLL